VASRDDDDGVLVLSQFTGAAQEMTEAIIVNPYDIDQAGDALAVALTMDRAERRVRMHYMRAHLAEFNVYRGAGRMLIDGARVELFREIVHRYRAEWNARNNVHAARVVTAIPLGDEESQSVRKALEAAVSGSVEMEISTDPTLVGGLRVEVGGHLFDGSVKGRLHALRQHLL